MAHYFTCPSECLFANHPGREHEDWREADPALLVEDAISRWEDRGPTSLTVALMAEALYAVRDEGK